MLAQPTMLAPVSRRRFGAALLRGGILVALGFRPPQVVAMSIEKQTFKRGPLRDVFAEGVRVGNVLYLAGQVGIDLEGRVGATLAEQTRLAYSNVASILAKFDATMQNVVDETIFVTSIPELLTDAAAFTAARSSFYGEKPDVAQTLVQVAGLFRPEFRIEIKCIAHL